MFKIYSTVILFFSLLFIYLHHQIEYVHESDVAGNFYRLPTCGHGHKVATLLLVELKQFSSVIIHKIMQKFTLMLDVAMFFFSAASEDFQQNRTHPRYVC